MATVNNILSPSQKRNITNLISQTFQEDLYGQLTLDLIEFKKQVNNILQQMKLEPVNKKYQFMNHTSRKNALAAKGYLLIFKFREFLLNEEIDYRYYFNDNAGNSKAISFKEKDILKYIKFGKEGIQINPTPLKKEEIDKQYSIFMNHYFTLYTVPDVNEYMRLIETNTISVRIVRSAIMKKFESSNPGLRKKDSHYYQTFNKGHIYEAIDSSISEMLSKNEEESDELITRYVFGKYLRRDTIGGSRGGDNPITNTSIKSGQADLYDYITIQKQLVEIKKILDLGLTSPEEAKKTIKNLFLHESKFESEELYEKSAEDALNKLLSILETKA